MHGVRVGHARGVPRRSQWGGSRRGALNACRYILSLDDGSAEARASERIALRLADALEVAWAPVPIPANHPRAEVHAQAQGTTEDREWVLAVAMPWSGAAADERVAQATAMGDWRATLDPDTFARNPAVDVELIVANLARKRMRRALERVVAPLLVVPADGDLGRPELAEGWQAPLALVPS